jgi:hypothetical protein
MTKREHTPLAFTIAEACAAARRTTAYKEIGEGRLRAIKHGSRTLVLPSDLRSWLESGRAISPKSGAEGRSAVRDCSQEGRATSLAEPDENQ